MSTTEPRTMGQLPNFDGSTAFAAQLELLDPSEEQDLAELGMADYVALVDSDREGDVEE